MTGKPRCVAIIAILCMLISLEATPAFAQSFPSGKIGATNGQIAGVLVGIAAAGAAIGVGVYFLVRHDHTLIGCTSSGVNGLELLNDGDHQRYNLIGTTADIKEGARIRVSGKKKGKSTGGGQTFLVEKLSKNFGPCHAPSAAP
jgi:hypothetical protein